MYDHTLCIKGERKPVLEETKTLRVHERLENEFERRFVLPIEADTKKVKAIYAKGVLSLEVPTTVETPRKITITKA